MLFDSGWSARDSHASTQTDTRRSFLTTSEQLPRLVSVIGEVIERSLMSTPDKWARAELPTDWPVAEALEGVASRIGALRVAVLRPFDKASVERADLMVEDRPSVITRWRNRTTHPAIPTLILGDARGDEEHGLRQLPEIVLDRQVLDRW